MSFPRYAKYKDSRVDWLGEVPAHWDVFPLKRDLTFLTSGSRGWAELFADDGALFIRIGNLTRDSIRLDLSDIQRVDVPEGAEGERTRVLPGDVLFSITAYLGSVAVAPEGLETSYVSQHVALARLRHRLFLPAWVGYVALSEIGKAYLESQGYGGTKVQLNLDDVANLIMTAPPLTDQQAVVAFLDRETDKIDALVAEQKKLIALLKEKRQSLIEYAVSGFPGMRTKLRYHVDLLAGYAFPSDGFSHETADMRLLRGINVGVDGVRWDDVVYWPSEEMEAFEIYMLAAGDLVFGLDRPWIGSGVRVAEIGSGDVPCLLLQRVARLRTLDGLHPAFLKLLLMSKAFFGYFEPELTGVSVPHISPDQILSYRFTLPSLEDQIKACDCVYQTLEQLQQVEVEARASIDLLKERRSALISAAVTGKIDVRGLVAAEAA